MRNRQSAFSLQSMQTIVLAAGVIVGAVGAPCAFAQEAEMSAEETAKALANPAGSLANLANNVTYRTFEGDLPDADSQDALSYTFQPVLPFPVGDKGRNIIVRPAFSLSFDQPIFDQEEGQFKSLGTNFNDIVFDTVYAGTTMTGEGKG